MSFLLQGAVDVANSFAGGYGLISTPLQWAVDEYPSLYRELWMNMHPVLKSWGLVGGGGG